MRSATVVGCGIVGLTSAITLQEQGFQVKIIAKEKYDSTLSSKVGAIWFPFEIEPKEKANTWASLAYRRYHQEANPTKGVSFIPFLTAYTAESNNDWTNQLPEGSVRNALSSELPKGMEAAFISIVPLAEPTKYLPHLYQRFIENGGSFENQEISSMEQLAALDELVTNCTGLGAKEICQDEDLHPMRGQILRCEKLPVASFANPTKKGALSYVINRSEDSVIGGTDYENDWNEKADPADTVLILDRLKDTGISQDPKILEILVGLRPRRSEVRFEFDANYPGVFHNYGHGGAGFTVAWGCALELAKKLKNLI
ncbi:FAD-binding oxidoreductase [Algoriphagus aestuariicola]|uniref:D-amino-acid oxidase n=1 Tax=Algoriphagus aestuariicola TaxID=1852016 RepID=A0ABS3BK27_9BACT|nr:FAD-dependent oxidoreductase [Algoriphagus aestuariicola]MBN7799663.1 FAD-binding oxidoreductase [Algoriphagus aestuariicola]